VGGLYLLFHLVEVLLGMALGGRHGGALDFITGAWTFTSLFAFGCFVAVPRSQYADSSTRKFLLVLAASAAIASLVKLLGLVSEGNGIFLAWLLLALVLLGTMCAEVVQYGRRNAGNAAVNVR
jgi:CDP-diglyceride synthetase